MSLELFKHTLNVDFIGKRFILIPLSLAVVVYGIYATFFQGLHYGIDFSGGTVLQLAFTKAPAVEEIRAAVDGAGVVASSLVAYPEARSALARRSREGAVPARAYESP